MRGRGVPCVAKEKPEAVAKVSSATWSTYRRASTTVRTTWPKGSKRSMLKGERSEQRIKRPSAPHLRSRLSKRSQEDDDQLLVSP